MATKNLSYGLLAPIEGAERVDDQMFGAHKYRNKLCEIELLRRAAFHDILMANSKAFAYTHGVIEGLMKKLSEACAEAKGANAKSRKRVVSKETKEHIKHLRGEIKKQRKILKNIRKDMLEDEVIEEKFDKSNDFFRGMVRTARSESGLYWGTYLLVEAAAKSMRSGFPPRFKSWDHRGKIGVQIQGGISAESVLSMEDSRVRVERLEGARAVLWIRTGSEGRDPIWAKFPMILHRPIHPQGEVKWVQVCRRRVGTKYKWSVLFTVTGLPARPQADGGRVGIDVGWRLMPGKGVRVLAWHGTDGDSGELILPADKVGRWEKAEELRSIRDCRMNEVVQTFIEWRRGASIPAWLKERTVAIQAWRSTAKLASVVLAWRDQRFDGDSAMYQVLEAWRKRDKHLYEWEANQWRKARAWRKDTYRVFANAMAKRYEVCCVENVDWSEFAKRPGVESDEDINETARRNRTIASVGELVEVLKDRFAVVLSVKAKGTTETCTSCGHSQSVGAYEMKIECKNCGHRQDRDLRAAENIVAREAEC